MSGLLSELLLEEESSKRVVLIVILRFLGASFPLIRRVALLLKDSSSLCADGEETQLLARAESYLDSL